MDIVIRSIAIFLEVILLAAIFYSLLKGVKLTVLDLGIGQKYSKMLTAVLMVVGVLIVVFLVVHLTSFYPAV
ncbi:hypothetical protein ACFLT4_02475 [Chloroflexota bacterium]